MTTFIFHGGGVDPVTNANDALYRTLVKTIPENGNVLLVYFASRTDTVTDRIAYDTSKCTEFALPKTITVTSATQENFLAEVSAADAIYLRGGSTEKLITTLKRYPDLKDAFKGKTVAGSSAGAYALSTYFSSHYEPIATEGLGIAPVRVITHFESTTMPPHPGAVEALKNTALDLELIILKEGELKVITC